MDIKNEDKNRWRKIIGIANNDKLYHFLTLEEQFLPNGFTSMFVYQNFSTSYLSILNFQKKNDEKT